MVATGDARVGPILTEIMWGTDLSQTDDPKSSQWLEIYNASDAPIDLSEYSLHVTPYSEKTYAGDGKVVEVVGNLADGKWEVPVQGGRSKAIPAAATTAGAAAVLLLSMRRTIEVHWRRSGDGSGWRIEESQ